MRKHRAKRQVWVPYNGKIADITHADTNKHTLDLETALSETRKIVAVILRDQRIAGTGNLQWFSNEGTLQYNKAVTMYPHTLVIADGTQRGQYSLTVANDDWDVFCHGYVVEV